MLPEKKIEQALIEKIEKRNGFIKKVAPKSNTGNKGYPDLTGVLDGWYLGIEVKRPTGGEPTPAQLRNLQKIANAGGLAIVTNDVQIVEFIDGVHQRLTTEVDIACLASEKITVQQARTLWKQTKGIHTLRIVPERSVLHDNP